MSTDALGNPLTLDSPAALAPLDDFVEGFIASEARAANILQAQDDPSPLVQAYCAALHMFAETGDAPANARPFIERAMRGAGRATSREQRFIFRRGSAALAWAQHAHRTASFRGDRALCIELRSLPNRGCQRMRLLLYTRSAQNIKRNAYCVSRIYVA